jgi:hypothetical protein
MKPCPNLYLPLAIMAKLIHNPFLVMCHPGGVIISLFGWFNPIDEGD